LEKAARRVHEAFAACGSGEGETVVRWGLAEDEAAVAALLELNGMPRWVAFEERFVVGAKLGGGIVAALRYRMEAKRLRLGLLVVDPWESEAALVPALYAGVGELARELGVREVLAEPVAGGDYAAREAGYRRGIGGWHLAV